MVQDKLISLAAAKAALREIVEVTRQDGSDPVINRLVAVVIENACERLEKLPDVQHTPAAPGRWERWAGGLVRCSVCGYEYTDRVECDNFCGNCGAKMDVKRGVKTYA